MTIRVLHLIGSLRLGGAQMCLKQIVENNDAPDIEHYVCPLRSKKIDIPIRGNVLSNPYPNYDPRKFFNILKICKKHKIDIIHAHLHKPILGALLTTYFQKIPVIVHEHGSIARPGIQYSIYRLMLKLLRKRARVFIAVSKAASNQLVHYAKIDPAHIQVVYNAVDLKKFVPRPKLRQSVRDELGIMPDDIAIGFVGRLSYVKGPDILMDAFHLLIKKNPNYMLVFLGRGDMEKRLLSEAKDAGIADRVKFLGFQENVAEIMNAFDIDCVPSRQEAFGISTIEMMAMKIPLVCSNADGLKEIVTHGQNALVPQENTPPQIADSIEQLTRDEALRRSLVENASVSVQRFDIPNLVEQVNQTYRTIAKTDNEHSYDPAS